MSDVTLGSFWVRFRASSVFHCHGVLVWRRAVFQHRIQYNGKKLGKGVTFHRVSEGTLESFLVRFRGLSVLPCHGVLVWRRAVFSTGFNTTGRGWEHVILYTASEGTLESFFVRFRGLPVLHCHSVLVSGFSVLHCHGVLVWRKAVFSTGFSTTGKGWEKAIFSFRGLSVYHCNGVLVWRRAVFSTRVSTTGKGWEKVKKYFLEGFRRDVREFFGAISWRVSNSLPWCFGVAEGCFQPPESVQREQVGNMLFLIGFQKGR